jgi:L-rhamnose mutarotase
MIVLQIEHPVPDFNNWKKAFDNDPMQRKQSGVKRYRIFLQKDDPNYVIVELEFDDEQKAELMLSRLQKLWNQVEGIVMTGAKGKIIELVEDKEY